MTSKKESSQILFEGTVGTRDFWKNRLGISNDDIQFLQSQLVLRKTQGSTTDAFRLEFVGLVCFQNAAFFSVPKIFRDQKADFSQAIELTLSCLRQYERKYARGFKPAEAGAGEFFDGAGTVVDMFLSVLNWTREHGFHQIDEKFRSDEFCNISWQDTIRQRYPIHFGRSVLYGEPIGYRTLPAHNELAQMQACALLELAKRLDVISRIWLPDYDELYVLASEIIRGEVIFRSRTEMRHVVDEHLFSSNRDTDRSLLDLLSRWLDMDYKVSTHIQLYGTNGFHAVWEHICAFLFHSLGTQQQHTDIASQPVFSDGGKRLPVSSQRPDILIESDDHIQIADAKWYDLDHGDLPHLEDIIKQLAYQMSIDPSRKVKSNVFLMPGLHGKSWSHAGQFEMSRDGRTDHRFPSVDVIRLDWIEMAQAYAKKNPPKWGEELLEFIAERNG